MPRDPTGRYTLLPVINPVRANTIIATKWANPTLDDIAAALTDSVSRSGSVPLLGPINMNGYRVTNIGAATEPTDAVQAQQVRDQAFIWLNPSQSDSSGNNYVATARLTTPPVNGLMYQFLADRNNTGPMTLAVNGGASLALLIHGVALPPGLILAGAVIAVVYISGTYRLISVASTAGTVNSVQSTDTQLISVNNDASTNIATLTPHANVPGGMVKLDGSMKVPVAQLPFQDLFFVGIWDAAPGINPSTAFNNGDFFVITVPGTLTIYRDSNNNIYTPQPTSVVAGDAIILRKGSVDPNAPDGWYFDPAAARPAVASTVSHTPTNPTWGSDGTSLQIWMNGVATGLAGMLPLAGGTMSGYILSPLVPSIPEHVTNKQYVDSRISAIGGVSSFNGRQGPVTLTNPDVTGALGFVPFSEAGGTITGNVVINENLGVAKGIGALYFAPTFVYFDAIAGIQDLDFFRGQSQRWNLAGSLDIQRVLNIPQGSIVRVAFGNLHGFTVTWPSYVIWPNGVTPDLASGALGLAIVVIESFSGGNGAHMAAATIY